MLFERYSHLLLPVAEDHFWVVFRFFKSHEQHVTRYINPCEDQLIVTNLHKLLIFLADPLYSLWLSTLCQALLSAYLPWPILGLSHVLFSYQHWSSVTLGFSRNSEDESHALILSLLWSFLTSQFPAFISFWGSENFSLLCHLILKGFFVVVFLSFFFLSGI